MKLFLASIIATTLASIVKAESIELRSDNIKDAINSGTWFIKYFSPYCPHCLVFAPDWEKLSKDLEYLEEKNNVHFGSLDCSIYGDLCTEHEITKYPTVQLWKGGEKVEAYTGVNQYDPLHEYISSKVVELDESLGLEVFDEMMEEAEEPVYNRDITQHVLPNPSGVSLELNGDKLKGIYKSNIPWFIKFYAPWCSHCKSLAPTWAEMASQLRGQVNVGEVNCDSTPYVCQEYDIQGYPTLKMFGFGEPISYTSDRSLTSLMKFANEHSGPSVKEVDAKELDEYMSVKDVLFLFLSTDKVPEMITQIANEFISTVSFFASNDQELIKKYGYSTNDLPMALILKDNTHVVYSSNDFKNSKTNRDKLTSWVENEQYPLVSKLGPSNYKHVLQNDVVVVLNIVSSIDTVSQSKFRNIATIWNKSVKSDKDKKTIYAEMNRSMWRDYVQDKFSVQHDETSKIIIYNSASYMYYKNDMNHQELSIDKPEDLYFSIKNIEKLKGETTLAIYERIGMSLAHGFSWIFKHWFISFIGFSIIGSLIYRYLTFHGPKRLYHHNNLLPTFKTVNSHYSHKD